MRSSRTVLTAAFAALAVAALCGLGCGARRSAAATAKPTAPPAEPSLPAGPSSNASVRILVTHPSLKVLERFTTLRELGLLPESGLEVVGIIHEQEWEDYGKAFAYAHDSGAWLRIERISCALTPESLFAFNECTPVFERLIAGSAGIVFSGGPDIPPNLYGEKTLLTTVIMSPRRQYLELSLLYHLLGRGQPGDSPPLLAHRPDYPVLAICMGMQAMNVATGGTLYQDVPSEIYGVRTMEDGLLLSDEYLHRNFNRQLDPAPEVAIGVMHPIVVAAGSRLRAWLPQDSDGAVVLSAHHQALEKLGAGLRVVATSTDGKVIEAVEHEQFAHVLGVQFHPDYLELWWSDVEFAATADAAVRNLAFAAMAKHPDSREFNRRIWLEFSRQATVTATSARD